MAFDASHFSMVGFEVDTRGAAGMTRTMERHLAHCAPSELPPPNLVCRVSDPSGGELTIGLRRGEGGQAEFVTLNPAFAGEGRAKVEIVSDVSDAEWKPFEVTVSARFAGEETPLVFDLADPTQVDRLISGAKVTVDIAAFSFAPSVYADEAAFEKDQAKAKVRFASTFFIPTGLLAESVGGTLTGDGRPTAYADFAGKVLKAELRANKAGDGKFWWALVETYGGATVDVVMDPRTIRRAPAPGAIVTGRFWLSARLAPAR
jgi:hypothetical protein